MAEKICGWKCPDCGFVYDVLRRGHPMDEPARRLEWCRRIPVTEEDQRFGVLEKWGLICVCGQSGRWVDPSDTLVLTGKRRSDTTAPGGTS